MAMTSALVLVVTYFASVLLPAAHGQVFDAGDIMIFIVAFTLVRQSGPCRRSWFHLVRCTARVPSFRAFYVDHQGRGRFRGRVFCSALLSWKELAGWALGSVVMFLGDFFANSYFIGLIFGASLAPAFGCPPRTAF